MSSEKMKRLNVVLASIVTALAEVRDGRAPEGHLYLAINGAGYHLDEFTVAIQVLKAGKLIEGTGIAHEVRLTKAGRDLAVEIEAKMAAAKQEGR